MKSVLSVLAASAVGLVACSVVLDTEAARGDDPAPAVSYTRDVAPFVKTYCVECHRGARARARVRLDEGYDGLMKAGRRDQSMVAAGAPDKSVLLQCLAGSGFKTMPPRKYAAQPTRDEIAAVRAWIAAGARNDP
jgi:hypothetical protein